MANQSVEVIGIYALPFSAALAEEQFEILYDGGRGMPEVNKAEAFSIVEEQLRSVVLVEVLVKNAEPGFSVDGFRKPERNVPQSNWQVAYAERFLTFDGTSAIADQTSSAVLEAARFRVAFYIHFWKPGDELLGPAGPLVCPEITSMPERLKELVPYPLLD